MEQIRGNRHSGRFRASRGTRYTKIAILLTCLLFLLLMHLNWITLDTSGYDTAYEYSTWSLVTAVLEGVLVPIGLLALYIIRLVVRLFVLVLLISTLSRLIRRDISYKKRFVLMCLAMILMFVFTVIIVVVWNRLTLSVVIAEMINKRPFSVTAASVICCVLAVLVPFVGMPLFRRMR